MVHDRLFQALRGSHCPYVVVEGLAVVLQGVGRLTHDVDLVVELHSSATIDLIDALEALGYQPRIPVKARDFADVAIMRAWIQDKGLQVFSLWDPSNELPPVDLFVEYPLPFDQLLENADVVDLGECVVKVASIEHLIEMKKKAGREHDLQDIAALKRLESRA